MLRQESDAAYSKWVQKVGLGFAETEENAPLAKPGALSSYEVHCTKVEEEDYLEGDNEGREISESNFESDEENDCRKLIDPYKGFILQRIKMFDAVKKVESINEAIDFV